MASHHVTIAKASFAASCLRPDVTQLTREEVGNFHNLLETTISKCSYTNIQTCKKWLLEHVLQSTQRVSALVKYLVSLSRHVLSNAETTVSSTVARKRLHILYLLNDLLHHSKYHTSNTTLQANLIDGVQTQLPELFAMASSKKTNRVCRRLKELIEIWEIEQYFNDQVLVQLRRATTGHDTEKAVTSLSIAPPLKEVPYIMPATHGDISVPYYDLPAANLMPHIIPNKSVPIRSSQVRALQLSGGPADENLVDAVKDFLKDVNKMENPYFSLEDEGIVVDMDEMGQVSYRNESDDLVGDTYYGWSRDFCDRMRKRGHEDNIDAQGRTRRYGRSQSPSRSRSSSRSLSTRIRGGNSRSRSPVPYQRYRSRSRSPVLDQRTTAFFQNQPTPPAYARPKSDTIPSLNTFNTGYPPIPLGAHGLPIPPPRPPNYVGVWPPPPPPPPPPPTQFEDMSFSHPPHEHRTSTASFPNNTSEKRR